MSVGPVFGRVDTGTEMGSERRKRTDDKRRKTERGIPSPEGRRW